jgi:bifunctional non-homologous end joining protein LigD
MCSNLDTIIEGGFVASVTLYNQERGSDKVYKLDLEATDGGFTVIGWNGRRGSSLKKPVPYAEAKKLFDSIIKEKTKKGYRPGEGGSAYVTATAGEKIGIDLQLLTEDSEANIARYINDDAYIAQEKIDGERRPVARHDTVIGGNRNGFAVALPRVLVDTLSALPPDTEIDAEQIGDTLYAFDLLKYDGKGLRTVSTLARWYQLTQRLAGLSNVVVVPVASTTEEKQAFYTQLRAERKEGIVFKRRNSQYSAGQNNDQIKIKFKERATVEVASVHPTKRSVGVQAYSPEGVSVSLGNVTIPANRPIPAVGEIVEVEYLYCVSKLYQPIFKGLRVDRSLDACTTTQLKFKAGVGEEDAENDGLAQEAA